MHDTDLRTLPERPRTAAAALAPAEPSHIHIPRPSRLRPSSVTPSHEASRPVQLELAQAEAA